MTFDERQGYIVLATMAAPLLAMVLLFFVPGSKKMLARYISLGFATIMLGLSVYIFVAYQVHGGDIQMELRWGWVQNVSFLKDGISLHLGIDGISALMTLLTGVVA